MPFDPDAPDIGAEMLRSMSESLLRERLERVLVETAKKVAELVAAAATERVRE